MTDATDWALAQRRIAERLATFAGSGGLNWMNVDPYIRRHLATHAARGGILAPLVADLGFVGSADGTRLIPELVPLTSCDDANVAATARAYLRLGPDLVGPDAPQRIANIVCDVATHDPGISLVTDKVAHRLPWRTQFAIGRPPASPSITSGGAHDLTVLTTLDIDRQTVIVTADLQHRIQIWSSKSGAEIRSWDAHLSKITALASYIADDRAILVSGSQDKSVRIWDPSTGELIERVEITEEVTALETSTITGSSLCLIGCRDGIVRVLNLETGELESELAVHQDAVTSVAHLRDQKFASGSLDRSLAVWQLSSERPDVILRGPTGSLLSIAAGNIDDSEVLVGAYADESIWVWNSETGEPIRQLLGHTAGVACVAIASNSKDNPVVISGGSDMTVRLWNLGTGSENAVLTGHRGGVRSVALAVVSDRSVAISCGADRAIRVWDTSTGLNVRPEFENSAAVGLWEFDDDAYTNDQSNDAHSSAIRALSSFKLSGRSVIASGALDGQVQIRDYNGILISQWDAHLEGVLALDSLVVSGQTCLVSAGLDGHVRSWDTADGSLLYEWRFGGSIWDVAHGDLSSGPVVVAGGRDRLVRILDPCNGSIVRELAGSTERIWGVACRRVGGRLLVAAGSTDRSVWLWDGESGELIRRFRGHSRGTRYVQFEFISGVPTLVASSADGEILQWHLQSAEPKARFRGHTDGAWRLSLGQVGDIDVVASASDDLTVRLWNLATGTCVTLPQCSPAYAVNFTDSRLIVGTNRHLISLNLGSELSVLLSGDLED